jgi:alpha-tubulin suppressor-like RCC1 family protein
MKRNTFTKLTILVVLLTAGFIAGHASRAAAQLRQIVAPPPGVNLKVPNPNALIEITAGFSHTCVRKYNGTVYCWGLNDNGQIGVISTATCTDSPVQDPNHISIFPGTHKCDDKPAFVATASAQVVAGLYHTCALNGGVASCWGSNAMGAVGNGTFVDQGTPQNVSGSLTFTRLGAGDAETCGLSPNGVYCWGSLPYKALSSGVVAAPTQLSTFTGFSNLAVGSRFACFVYIVGAWGENDCQGVDDHGQLGLADSSWLPSDVVPNTSPAVHIPYAPFMVMSTAGVASDGSPHVSRSAAGSNYACADIQDGTVQCFGGNDSGQLGTSGGDSGQAQTVVDGNGNTQLHGVTTGSNHACALDLSGTAWCWGLGQYGELGNNSSGHYGWSWNSPQQVTGTVKFRALAAGGQHTCGIGTDNFVYCWGDNEYGQLGIGRNTTQLGLTPSGFTYATNTGKPQQVPAF